MGVVPDRVFEVSVGRMRGEEFTGWGKEGSGNVKREREEVDAVRNGGNVSPYAAMQSVGI